MVGGGFKSSRKSNKKSGKGRRGGKVRVGGGYAGESSRSKKSKDKFNNSAKNVRGSAKEKAKKTMKSMSPEEEMGMELVEVAVPAALPLPPPQVPPLPGSSPPVVQNFYSNRIVPSAFLDDRQTPSTNAVY